MGTSDAQIKATLKYKAKAYKRIPLDVRIEEYEALKSTLKNPGKLSTVSSEELLRKILSNPLTYSYVYSII